jgi:hypothetical protein
MGNHLFDHSHIPTSSICNSKKSVEISYGKPIEGGERLIMYCRIEEAICTSNVKKALSDYWFNSSVEYETRRVE